MFGEATTFSMYIRYLLANHNIVAVMVVFTVTFLQLQGPLQNVAIAWVDSPLCFDEETTIFSQMGNIDLCNLCKHRNMKAIPCLTTTHIGFSTPSQLTGGCAQEATRVNWEFAPLVRKCPLGWPCCTCILKSRTLFQCILLQATSNLLRRVVVSS